MENSLAIHAFLLIPLCGFVVSLLLKPRAEQGLSLIAFGTSGANLLIAVMFIPIWVAHGAPALNIREVALYRGTEYEFLIDFYFDTLSAVFLLTGSVITFLIARYARYYLHREQGYKRFFNTVLLFYMGFVITVLSGNFETLFAGWEILGISSFMLIAFYRDRYLPVKNAVKVFSIYRIGDVGILLAMWASHHLWHENITFLKLNNAQLVHQHLEGHSGIGLFISVMLLLAAAAKSAQLPFTSWLPRAMEGPTPSSAIFYGSLSVHFGVFLLMRTEPFWENQQIVRWLIAGVGLTTSLVAWLIARVQSTVKSQIAYASVVQIGIIFVEVAAGFDTLALIHFSGNAFLRTYQLLVSPSIVAYKVRQQLYHFIARPRTLEDTLPLKIAYTLYVLSLKEWNLDRLMSDVLFRPMKMIGHRLDFLTRRNLMYVFLPFFSLEWYLYWHQQYLPQEIVQLAPEVCAAIGLLFVLRAFAERKSPRLVWMLILLYHLQMALAVSYNTSFNLTDLLWYFSGVVPSLILGYACILRLRTKEPTSFDLYGYHGHSYEHPRLSYVFLLAVLGYMGFPITGTFIGEDLLFSHIRSDEFLLAFFNASSFIIAGIALIRLYARLFLGPHAKAYHAMPYPSS